MDDFYKQMGYEQARNLHGNPQMLPAFFDQIYQQLILDPEYKEQINPRYNQHEQEKINLEARIDELTNKIQDVRSDEEKFRREKQEKEEIARKYDLEHHKIKFNPNSYNVLRFISYLLIAVIVIVYSIFFMHLFSKPSAKILPPIGELTQLIQNYWLACFLTIIPLALGYTIDLILRTKHKMKVLGIIIIGLFASLLDFVIAYATRMRIAQANELLGLETPPLLTDTNFWIVIFIGPLPIILLSIILHFKHKSSREYIEEQSKNPYRDLIKELREKEIGRKHKAEELEQELENLRTEYNRLLNFTEKIQYIPKEQLDTRIFNFYNGWIEWITNMYNNVYERENNLTKAELLSKCKYEYDKFNNESQSKFTTIYPTF